MTTAWIADELLFWHDTGHGAHFVPSGPWVEPMPHVANGGEAGIDTMLGRGSYEIALLSAGAAYRAVTAMLLEASGGRLAMCHEGGYDAAYVPFCGLAILEELSGTRTDCVDPFLGVPQRGPGEVLQPHQDAAVARAAALVDRVPRS